jgi:tetratricopeptide (TPR) repeat protein
VKRIAACSRPIAAVLLVACASGITLARKPVAPAEAAAAREKAAPEIERLFDQAHTALRSGRREDAVAPAQKAVAIAEQLPASDELRIRTLSQAGALFWSVNRKDLAKPTLKAAVRQIEAAPRPAPPEISRMVFHMLGVIHRDEQRHEDAIPWFLRAVQVSTSLPEATREDAEGKHFALAFELRTLAWAQCRANQSEAANETDERRVAACTRLPRQNEVNACRDGKRTCVNRWLSQSH